MRCRSFCSEPLQAFSWARVLGAGLMLAGQAWGFALWLWPRLGSEPQQGVGARLVHVPSWQPLLGLSPHGLACSQRFPHASWADKQLLAKQVASDCRGRAEPCAGWQMAEGANAACGREEAWAEAGRRAPAAQLAPKALIPDMFGWRFLEMRQRMTAGTVGNTLWLSLGELGSLRKPLSSSRCVFSPSLSLFFLKKQVKLLVLKNAEARLKTTGPT